MTECWLKFRLQILALLFTLMGTQALAQEENIREQILNYDQGKTTIIQKGRSLLLETFKQGNISKMEEVFNYLLEQKDEYYLVFYPIEEWLIYYHLQRYEEILDGVTQSQLVDYNQYLILPPKDLLPYEIIQRMSTKLDYYLAGISNSDLIEQKKDFLALNLRYLLLETSADTQEFLNEDAELFLNKYKQSPYENYIRQHVRYVQRPADWALSIDFFSGFGLLTDDLPDYFNHSIPFGLSMDVYYKKFVSFLRIYIGFSRTRQAIQFPAGTWPERSAVRIYKPEITFGFVSLDTKLLRVAPFVGIGTMSIEPTEADIQQDPRYDEFGLDFTTTYSTGINIDLKLGSTNTTMVAANEEAYWYFRFRYSYNQLRYFKKYGNFSGDMHNFTIGIGGFGRPLKRDY